MQTGRSSGNILGVIAFWSMVFMIGVSLPVLATDSLKQERILLATVNGDSIFTADIDAVFAGIHSSMTMAERSSFDYRKLLNKLVNDRLLIQEADAMGIAEEGFFQELLDAQRKKLVSNKFVQLNFQRNDSVSQNELTKYFTENFHKIKVRTVSIEGKAAADSILAAIQGGAPMDSIAKQRSLDVHRYQGGAQSLKYWANLEAELRSQITEGSQKRLYGPFPYGKVYCILRVDETAPADLSELPNLTEHLTGILKSQKAAESRIDFVSGLRSKYGVTIDSSAIAGIAASVQSVLDPNFQNGGSSRVAGLAGQASLTESELRRKAAHAAMSDATAAPESLLYRTLDEMLEDAVLFRAGMDQQLDTLTSIQRKLDTTRDSALIEIYLKETVVTRVRFNHDEFQDYYQEHLAEFREPDDFKLRQVLIGSQARADSAAALLADGAEFDYVADQFRQGTKELAEKTQTVSLLAFPESARPDFEKLKIGQSSKAYQTADGWLIFKVLDRKPGRQKTLEEVDINIREVMFQRQFGKLLDETLAKLKFNSTIEFYDEAIDNYLGAQK